MGDVQPQRPAAAQPSSASNTLSPKVGAAALGSAISIIAGILLAHLVKSLSETEIATLTGAIATVLSFALGYLINDPRRV